MSKGAPKKDKKEEEDDSTLRLAQGYRKRCDNYGIVPSPAIKGRLDELLDGAKGQSPKFELVAIMVVSGIAQKR
jgi:hypothetical protein